VKYSVAGLGRVFVVRLEDGDVVHESVEQLRESPSYGACDQDRYGLIDPRSDAAVVVEAEAPAEREQLAKVFPSAFKMIIHYGRGEATLVEQLVWG